MDSYQSPLNIMRGLDCKMVKFFHSVIRLELKKKKRKYGAAVKEVIKAYSRETIRSGESDICFDTPATRCAYVFLHCACIATGTAYHFLQLLKSNATLFRRITFSDSFRVCCLGGGPGTDIVAIVKILEGLLRSCCPTRRKPLVVKATIVDANSGWSVTAINVIKMLYQHVDTSLILCELNFIESNLAEPFTSPVTDAIREADFVTTIRFLSAVHGSRSRNRINHMLQDAISLIKEDGTLFLIDSFPSFDAFRQAMESFPDMTETYGPVVRDLHKMSFYSVADNIKLNKEYFGGRLPLILAVNFISAWTKGGIRNPANRRTASGNDEESWESQIKRHFSKCLRFCFHRPRDTTDFGLEYSFEDKGMFNTKPKSRRIASIRNLKYKEESESADSSMLK